VPVYPGEYTSGCAIEILAERQKRERSKQFT